MTIMDQLNPFDDNSIACYVFYFLLGVLLARFVTWLSRRIRTPYPRKFRSQQKIRKLYRIVAPEFTMICGPRKTKPYTKQEDRDQMENFLSKLFPNHPNKIPENVISVWVPRKNFKTGRKFQEFVPVDGVALGSWFSYRMVCARVQETLYNYEGKRYMAGICIYMRLTDEWWWWAPAIERYTVENAYNNAIEYIPAAAVKTILPPELPKYEDVEAEAAEKPPSYTAVVIERGGEEGDEDEKLLTQ